MTQRVASCLLMSTMAIGCNPDGSNRIPKPWYTEVVPDVLPIAIRYDEGGLLHVVWKDSTETLHYGIIDPSSEDRHPEDLGVLTLNGAALVESWAGSYNVALAPRPGTDEIWIYVNGTVGVLTSGTAEIAVRIDLGYPPGSAAGGSIAFEDKGTLHVGSQGADWVIYPISDSGEAGTPEIFVAEYNGAPYPLQAPCDLDIGENWAFAMPCDSASSMRVELSTRRFTPAMMSDDEDATYVSMLGPVAAAGNAALNTHDTALCILPVNDDGYMVAKKKAKVIDGLCDGYNYYGFQVMPERADITPGGDAFALAYLRRALVLVQEDKPKAFEKDKEGEWCNFNAYPGLPNFELEADGDLKLYPTSGGGTEILYEDWTWSQSKNTITTDFTGQAGDFETEGDESFEHWALRTGDTLVIRTTTHERTADHYVNAGFTTMSGVWLKCD